MTAQNYLCQHQHESQGLHWLLPQVTLHPTVVHYRYPVDNCHLVTHNALFFGVRHGRGPCDACTGRVKQGITRLVKTSTEVVNSAKSFFNVATEHLAKENAEPGKCIHFKQTFHFTSKIPSRPKGSGLTAVPETRQLNCVCNNGQLNEVMTRKVVCCCTGCLRRSGLCDNSEYIDEWQAFNMQQRKVVPLNWNIWLTTDVISNLPNGRNAPLTWLQRLQQMESTGDY